MSNNLYEFWSAARAKCRKYSLNTQLFTDEYTSRVWGWETTLNIVTVKGTGAGPATCEGYAPHHHRCQQATDFFPAIPTGAHQAQSWLVRTYSRRDIQALRLIKLICIRALSRTCFRVESKLKRENFRPLRPAGVV
jgi:hypothetical protein